MGAHSRWSDATSHTTGADYAARFTRLAEQGVDVHGEAAFCAGLLAPGARVLDAGCGTGRVASRLAELGYDCVGVDGDPSMLATARGSGAQVEWLLADLADTPSLARAGRFDLIVAAGNVMPLLAIGSETAVIANLAAALRTGGALVAGFGLDAAHLPLPEAPFGLTEYDAWCGAAGLSLAQRFATWSGGPYEPGGGYAVSVHRAAGRPPGPQVDRAARP